MKLINCDLLDSVANNLIREKYSLLKEKRHLHKELDSLSEGESKARKVLSVAENKKKQFEEYEKKEEIKEKRDKSVQEFLSFMDSVGFRVEFISVNEKELEAKLRENKISELEGKFKFIFTRINPVEHSRPYHVLVDIQNKRINGQYFIKFIGVISIKSFFLYDLVNFVDLAGDSTKLASEVEQTVNSYESIDFRLLIWLLRRKIKDAVMSTLNEKENH